MRQDPHELLRRGRALLADPQANTNQLEKALMNIHSALEQHFVKNAPLLRQQAQLLRQLQSS